MNRIAGALLLLLFFATLCLPLTARPPFLEQFKGDPFRNPSLDGCGTCHVNPLGGGPRNPFGLAFAESGFSITPMLRANFPDRFIVKTAQLADGSTLYFADPKSESMVYEKNKEKRLVSLAGAPADEAKKEEPKPKSRFSFFVTSAGTGKGGNLGGLAGADRHCQSLASAAGGGDRVWRAYLSTILEGTPIINAGDRIGSGPWFNVKGMLVARGVAHLHSADSNLNAQTALTEKGEAANLQDLVTGSRPDGTASDTTCDNWTNSACSQRAVFYCFAVD
jgi:hypothetical protein